jgi:TPP-dependent pyruvate/acetoin dehydrogenase alpha subunit
LSSTHLINKFRVRLQSNQDFTMAFFAEEQVVKVSPGSNILNTAESPLISNEKLRNLYLAMLRLRRYATEMRLGRFQRRLPTFAEAACVGCAMDLSPEDTLTALTDLRLSPTIEMAVQSPVLQSNPMSQNDLRSEKTSARIPSQPPDKHSHFQTEIQLPHSSAGIAFATGMASLHAMQGKGRLVLAFVNARQMAQSRETLKFCYQNRLPIIFVQIERSSHIGSRARRSRASGTVPSIPVDRADVVAVYRVASEAIDKARRGAGPTTIECLDYRVAGAKKARTQSRDPLIYMEEFLRKRNLWTDDLERTARRPS